MSSHNGAEPVDLPVPYDLRAEIGVLAGLVASWQRKGEAPPMAQIAGDLAPGHFFSEAHGLIYAAALRLYQTRTPVDHITITAELQARGQIDAVGGYEALGAIFGSFSSSAFVEHYAAIIRKHAQARRRIQIGGQLAALGYRQDLSADDLLAAERTLIDELHQDTPDAWVSLRDVWAQNVFEMEELQAGRGTRPITTGFPKLDAALTGGLRPGDAVIVAALTSRGKTAMALHLAAAAAADGKSVGVVSLESFKEAMGVRLLARESAVDSGVLRAGTLGDHDWRKVVEAQQAADDWAGRLWFLDNPSQTVEAVEAYVDRLRSAPGKGCDLLVVDYLQLMEGPKGGNREREVAAVSRGIKNLAMRHKIPVVELSQLSRAAVGADQPGLHHLRESGAIEQDANIVCFLHRPNADDPSLIHLLVAKQREGPSELAIPLRWYGSTQTFEEIKERGSWGTP